MLGGLFGFWLVGGLGFVGLIGVEVVVGDFVLFFVCVDGLVVVGCFVGEYVFDLWVDGFDDDIVIRE